MCYFVLYILSDFMPKPKTNWANAGAKLRPKRSTTYIKKHKVKHSTCEAQRSIVIVL